MSTLKRNATTTRARLAALLALLLAGICIVGYLFLFPKVTEEPVTTISTEKRQDMAVLSLL